jgi:hypothetical protein
VWWRWLFATVAAATPWEEAGFPENLKRRKNINVIEQKDLLRESM